MTLKKTISKERFNPKFIGFFINYNFLIRRKIYEYIDNNSNELSGKLLDFGCGLKPYKHLFKRVNEYIGVDYYNEDREKRQLVDVYYNGKHIPFENNTFDSILCTEVLEHVFNLDELLIEFNRVLKPGGKIIVTTPFMWEEHEQPYDFARYSSFALLYLYPKNGFDVLKHSKLGNDVEVINQFCINYIKNIFGDRFVFLLIPFAAFFNFLGLVFGSILPTKQTTYFNNAFVLVKNKV